MVRFAGAMVIDGMLPDAEPFSLLLTRQIKRFDNINVMWRDEPNIKDFVNFGLYYT